jgi:multidrug efflux system membrane fusion protein
VVFALLAVWRSVRNAAPPARAKAPVDVAAMLAQSRDVADELRAIGSLRAAREVLLAPDVAGRVTAIHFEAGQFVKEGALLVQLFDAPERADRAAAIAQAEFAQTRFLRAQELLPLGAVSRELFEEYQAEAARTAAAVRQLDARIRQKNIHAPFSGLLGIRRVNPGQYLNAGEAIATLTRLDELYVDFTVPQQELSRLALGGEVAVRTDALPGRTFAARINAIEPRIHEETRNVIAQARLPNAEGWLKPGMYVTAHLALPATRDAIVLPLTAILTSASGDNAVLVRDADAKGVGKAAFTPIKTGRRLGDEVIVEEGLTPGDIVITSGQNRLSPGVSVRIHAPLPEAAPAAAAPDTATALPAPGRG